jgi:hypothetical protein
VSYILVAQPDHVTDYKSSTHAVTKLDWDLTQLQGRLVARVFVLTYMQRVTNADNNKKTQLRGLANSVLHGVCWIYPSFFSFKMAQDK